jgi:hypothetical protein
MKFLFYAILTLILNTTPTIYASELDPNIAKQVEKYVAKINSEKIVPLLKQVMTDWKEKAIQNTPYLQGLKASFKIPFLIRVTNIQTGEVHKIFDIDFSGENINLIAEAYGAIFRPGTFGPYDMRNSSASFSIWAQNTIQIEDGLQKTGINIDMQ